MALKKTFSKSIQGFAGELVCTDAYWRVTEIVGNKSSIKFVVCAFSDNLQVDGRTYEFKPSVDDGSDNFIKQAYEHLKTLPEFSGSQDC